MVKKWEIYFVNLNPIKGSEQSGQRPALVVSNNAVNTYLPVCTVIPFSSHSPGTKTYPTEILIKKENSGLKKDSILMLQQIRTIDAQRLISPAVSMITDESLKKSINFALKEYFEL